MASFARVKYLIHASLILILILIFDLDLDLVFLYARYPHLIHASVASSAPVQAVDNMQGYMNVMSDNFKLADVGGSDGCYDGIKEAFSEVGLLLNQVVLTP